MQIRTLKRYQKAQHNLPVQHGNVASLTQVHVGLLGGVSVPGKCTWGRTAGHQPPFPSVVTYSVCRVSTSWRGNTSEVCVILLSAYCSFDCGSPGCPLLYNSNIVLMLLLHSFFITFSPKWCQQWSNYREALSVREGTVATQSQQKEGVCATCAIACRDEVVETEGHACTRISAWYPFCHQMRRLLWQKAWPVHVWASPGEPHAWQSGADPPTRQKPSWKQHQKSHLRQSQKR